MIPVQFKCPAVQSISALNASEYMGVWYEQTRIKNEFFQKRDSVCTQAFYFDLNESG
jgi:lipocalin